MRHFFDDVLVSTREAGRLYLVELDPQVVHPGARSMALATSVQLLLTENPVLGWFAGSLGSTFSCHTVRLPLTLGPPGAVRTPRQTAMSATPKALTTMPMPRQA